MPRPFAWSKLKNDGHVVVSPRSGHTLTATSAGFILYGGMDGRRNDLGNPAPNSDLYILKLGAKGTFEWHGVEIDAGSQTPPVRTLHTAIAVSSDEMFVYGGIHSTTPYQSLNDGWTLDTTCFEWRRCQFKTSKPEHKGSYLRRVTGKIPEYLMQTTNTMPSQPTTRISKKPHTGSAGITFESLAMAASRAVSERATFSGGGSQGGQTANVERTPSSTWGKKAWKKILMSKKGGMQSAGAGAAAGGSHNTAGAALRAREMKLRKQRNQGASLMMSEEEQFHDDILKLVSMGSTGSQPGADPGDAASAQMMAQLPAPRANHSTALFENTLVLFGGHGGLGYQRRAFNDVWTLNLDNNRWAELICRGTPPAPRSGHASFEKDGTVYIFGGWNTETQFNDLFALDVENKDWMDLDLQWSVPRWNMAVQLVEAIPSWRVFIFGGSADSIGGRSMGVYDRSVGVLDLGEELRWDAPTLEERPKDERPLAREHTALCYDAEEGRLVIFGGWANKWLDDCWQINVSSIVGPPYAIAAVRPPLGPVSGLQKIQVLGIGFQSTPGAVTVRFIAAGGRHVQETQGTVKSDELIECTTPNVVGSIGPRECEVRVQIGSRDFTTTVTDYHYFLNTVAGKSLCYGPGLLEEQQAGQRTKFIIQARNELGENRKSGRDEWVLQVQQVTRPPGSKEVRSPSSKGRSHAAPTDQLRDLPFEIEDVDNGQYEVRYIGEVGDVLVHVSLQDEHGKLRPVRGSPFRSTHIQYAKSSANDYLGASVHTWLMSTLKQLEDFNRSTEQGLQARPKEDDVKGLIKVMNHIQELRDDEDTLIRKQDEIFETLAHLERGGVPIDKQQKTLNKIRNNLEQVKELSHKVSASIAPTVQTQKDVYRKKIATFEAELRVYQGGLKREAYYVYNSGVELAQKKLRDVTEDLDRKTTELQDLLHIANNFEYPEELTRSQMILQQMRDEVAIVCALWEYEISRIKMTEEFLVKRWHQVKADEMEDAIKSSLKKLKETKIDKKLDVYLGMQSVIKDWTVFCPLVAELRDPSMRPRHWSTLMGICGKVVQVTPDMLLRDVWNMELHKLSMEVQDLGEQAKQEAQMEAKLSKLAKIWSSVEFETESHRGSDISLLTVAEEHVDTLEENQVEVQNMFALRFLATFETEVVAWQRTLANITEVSGLLSEVQRTWVFLENLFIYSEEVKKELPEESDSFVSVDFEVRQLLRRGAEVRFVKPFCCEAGIFEALERAQAQLQVCEKALNEFMDGKRRTFPRFYFMSSADLLDVLSNGNNPARVVPLFPKFFNAIEKYDLAYPMEEQAVQQANQNLLGKIQDINVDLKKMRVDLKKKIEFVEGKAEFKTPKVAGSLLDQVASVIIAANAFLVDKGEAIFHLRITGHTDEPNQDLSFNRAKAVRDAVSAKAVTRAADMSHSFRSMVDTLFVAEGYSDDRPLPGRDKADKENSRIEIQMIAEGGKEGRRGYATGMHACIGKEFVPFPEPLRLDGKVEVYLEKCIGAFRGALQHFTKEDLDAYAANGCEEDGAARGQWLLGVKAAQCGLLVQLITWVKLVEGSFEMASASDGKNAGACQDAWDRQKTLLLSLIELTMTELSKPDRQKLMCAITLDAHNRDVQERLVNENVTTPDAFQWQSMLKSYWEDEEKKARMCICDATLEYAYEYLGNGGRLVVTPLTDRIYVTATQALHLCMGCAPAGPAGTGKTESTKDLANALARACYVINAAPEMDYLTLGSIFKGLAASGSWGCFDEFNRLVPEVLSVCTVQFKAVCDAVRKQAKRFFIQGDEMSLDTGVGVFITMNPGYLGRSELPEGLKALFRPITVMVPDFMLIMENMFMSEGFLTAKELALKFSTLYALNKDLLSKSNKYDWGMRAIKSVLVVAGGFKRADPSLGEAAVLMRSLRDTNVAKIEGDDLKIFMGLLSDLFPGIDVPRARDLNFERIVVETMEEDFGYTNDQQGYLLLKITQLVELLAIRHSVFLMGGPGSFKSSMWKVLRNAKTKIGEKTTVVDFSPKAITTNELYGSVNMSTREWKDGILSKTMRDLGLVPDTMPKWIMLDGDLDANWIESMNSVMDDSRLLTLPSNERIPLKPHMKMIFEIRDLNYATPATATRAGIVCMSDSEGVQWRSYVSSWIKKLVLPEKPPEKADRSGGDSSRGTRSRGGAEPEGENDTREQLHKLFEKYCPATLKWMSKSAKIQVPMVDIAFVSVLCSLLDALFSSSFDSIMQTLEHWFVFCIVYAIGGCLAEIDGTDYRKQFSNWWKNEMKTVKYPSNGLVFDFFVRDGRLEDWTNVPELKDKVEYSSSTPMGEVTVPTSETVAANYFMKALIKVHHPVMLIGLAGCGKTQSCAGMLQQLCQPSQEGKQFTFHKMNMSYYTDSTLLQTMMEIPLEKKTGKRFAPPGKLHLIYFIDDLNMPALDKYNTQSAIELIKQKQDYDHWYDRTKIQLKEIINTQYLCCMNPTAGSFSVNPRLQRHFWTCAVPFPKQSALSLIYSTFTEGHMRSLPFKVQVQELASAVIKAALSLHSTVSAAFRKTAKNMHYEFNIRHMSGVFAGLLQAQPKEFAEADKFVLLWIHESERIYGDRLVSVADLRRYRTLVGELCKKMFGKFNFARYFAEKNPEPLVFAPFAKGLAEMADGPCYDKIKDIDRLSEILSEAMREYDASNPAMDLVLFEDAMKHVAKICRIISRPSGHPLLVGVGGSGRQSLSRLSAFVCQCVTTMIVISSTYGLYELKADLQKMYKKAGEKDEGVLFLFTDNQIANERFLVFFNDLLASGEITDLFPNEDKDAIRNVVRGACKAEGITDTPDNLWNFYLSRVRKNLHMSLCFSPVGDGMWSRARKFPALVNCTVIDWFQPWPVDALRDVAAKFLHPVEQLGPPDAPLRQACVDFFPFSFEAVNELSQAFIQQERRYAYTTPKSFLELIKLYTLMLGKKVGELSDKKMRLSTGLVKLFNTSKQVSKLEEELNDKAVVVKEKMQKAGEVAEEVALEEAKVRSEAQKASLEASTCDAIAKQVSAKEKECKSELAKALPLVEEAKEALEVLDKKEFQELKGFKNPPAGVDTVCYSVMHLQAGIDPNIDVDKKGRIKDNTWKSVQKMMVDPTKFLANLKGFQFHIDEMKVPPHNVEEARRLKDSMGDDFSMEVMKQKSQAAGGLCAWVINIIKYYDVVIDTEPKKRSLQEAEETLAQANRRKEEKTALVESLQAKLDVLVAEFRKATAEKDAVMAEAERCQSKLKMANRLINALSANGEIWKLTVEKTAEDLVYIPGDSVVACSFASYLGVFTREYRERGTSKFIEFLESREVPLGPSPDPLNGLSTEADRALWCTKGLPSDRFSLENGAIMTNSERWCLMVDPQAQGVVWVKQKEADHKLMVTRMGHAKMVHTFEAAIQGGCSVLIENMSEQVDAVLQPVIARNYIKRGGRLLLKIGDKELVLNQGFQLFMQTKLSNPHYPPEVQAECTVINFTVTESGLEEQLLFLVVKLERPDLARQKSEVIQQQNEFKVRLAELEAQLLEKLSSAEGDILEDVELIQSLEDAKATSDEVKEKVVFAQELETRINLTSESYRDAASRGSLLFFLMMDLGKMHTFYKYSLDAFVMVVSRAVGSVAIKKPATPPPQIMVVDAELDPELKDMQDEEGDADGYGEEKKEEEEFILELSGAELVQRVILLKQVVTMFVFNFLRRGLLDADKLTVASMLALRVLVRAGDVKSDELSLLIRAPLDPAPPPMPESMKSWLSETHWAQLKCLELLPVFKTASSSLTQAIEQDSLGWKRWFAEERAEAVDLPRGCREISNFHRLFLLRVLRPDRIGAALHQFVVDNMGNDYVEQSPFSMMQTYEESSRLTPIFFVLFPGTDPTPMVEAQAAELQLTEANGKLVNISMGQGQEQVAIAALHKISKEGGWVMLQNIHLMQAWLRTLERNLELLEEFSHPDFRCILTSEPPSALQGPMWEIIPESILQKCIKIADEAPTDLKSNLRRAWSKFGQQHVDACVPGKQKEFKATLFALCFFHSLILGRIKFGAQGWSKKYPFNDGDLTICGQVLCNYLNNAEKLQVDVPWADIRYLFGEIMYGGHITDYWDRRVNNTYLAMLVTPELLTTPPLQLCKGFRSPDPAKSEYGTYSKVIEDKFPAEAPELFSLHPNAEIGYLTNQGSSIFKTVQGISGSDSGTNTADISASREILVKYLEELPPDLDMLEIRGRLRDEDYTPYVIGSLQESDRMNLLLQTIRSSLQELELGIGGQLNVTEKMEKLSDALQLNAVAEMWKQLAYASLKPLGAWFVDLLKRVDQLTHWTVAPGGLLLSTWISGLFNPMAFLTAVMQVTARDRMMPLDFMTNRVSFLNTMDPTEFLGAPVSGIHVHGLFMEGASWEEGKGDDEGYITASKMKELHTEMPVVNVYSVLGNEMSWENMYHCPVFMTADRGATYVTQWNVRMDRDDDERVWVLAGAALVLTDDDR